MEKWNGNARRKTGYGSWMEMGSCCRTQKCLYLFVRASLRSEILLILSFSVSNKMKKDGVVRITFPILPTL